ncbi:DinB family protein [Paenibacillus sp. PL2-23]
MQNRELKQKDGSQLLRPSEEKGAFPPSIEAFGRLREETIDFAESVPASQLDRIMEGSQTSIRWHLGHLLAAWDHGIFPKLGGSWLLPTPYHTLFPEGTSPSSWSEEPPSQKELVTRLREQMEDIMDELSSHLDYPLAEPFKEMSSMSEVLDYLLDKERQELKTMKELADAIV